MRQFMLLFLGFMLKNGICSRCQPNIAVIGGGIGGASTSHYLTELFRNKLHIDLYEAKSIGGRLATVSINQKKYEAGGSIIHDKNQYMKKFVKLLGLEHTSKGDDKFGIWNGKDFVLKESSFEIFTLAKLIFLYGFEPFSLYRYVNSVQEDFAKIYELQDNGASFTNVIELLKAMNPEFPKLLHISIKDHLLDMGYSEKVIDELVRATLLVNYGQNTDVHSFVGCVSLLGAGAGLWAVKGGNKMVPEHLIYRNSNVTVVPSYVQKIRNLSNTNTSRYEIHYYNEGSDNIMTSIYDMIIIAAPLTHDQKRTIAFENFTKDIKFSGEYQTTVASFVKGNLNLSTFDLSEEMGGILSCNPENIINSIGKINQVEDVSNNEQNIWKIFSKKPLKSEEINNFVIEIKEMKEIIWKAYPKYSTNIRFDEFKLGDFLYHVNAIEWAASAMEMSAIAGRNVAILAHREYSQQCSVMQDDSTSAKSPIQHQKIELR